MCKTRFEKNAVFLRYGVDDGLQIATDVANSATASLNFGDEDVGCQSSDVWPHQGGGCILSPAQDAALSDDFHVYSLEWEEDEFRWWGQFEWDRDIIRCWGVVHE